MRLVYEAEEVISCRFWTAVIENINFKGKNITVISESGPEDTTIDGNQDGSVVTFDNGEDRDSALIGFTITNGLTDYGGGIFCNNESSPTIDGNYVIDNTAYLNGGGFYVHNSTPLITKNDIAQNGTGSAGNGGGIYSAGDPSSEIISNTVSYNTAGQCGGGIFCADYDPVVLNNIIYHNEALTGGGLYGQHIFSELTNNTITFNTATIQGGGVYFYNCMSKSNHPFIANSILFNNTSNQGPQMAIGTPSGPSFVTISYSDVEGGEDDIYIDPGCTLNWGPGMIDEAPEFVDSAIDDFHLKWVSPCRDTGDNSVVSQVYDFEGDPRIAFDTVDMGADEFYNHLYCTGDFTPNGEIEVKITGVPGTWPVGLFISFDIMIPPLQHKWGEFHLASPWWLYPLFSIPADGVLRFSFDLPPDPAHYDVFMQALIGWKLSNLFVLKVRQ